MGHQIASSVAELHELQVVLQEPTIVRPEKITDMGNLYLSPLDRQAPFFMYTLHVYNGKANSIAAHHVLIQALQKVLVLYYPAAGRIMRNEDTGHKEIACSGEGAMFVEAIVHLELKDLGDLRHVNPELEKRFVYQLRPTSENPLLVVQITSFSCGGFILGLGWRHELFDGFSVAQFLTAWADLARGTPLSAISPPNHNRRLLQPQHSSVDTVDFEQIIKKRFFGIPILKEDDLNKNRKNSWESTLNDFSSSGFLPKYITKMFQISEEMVASLKQKAMDGELISTCSAFDVITAHAWLSRVKAMEINPSERILLEFAVNGRPKTIPPLPENFVGNAFIMASHNCTAGDILNSSFQDIVRRVQLAKATITDAYIRTNISTLEGTNTKALPSFRETSIFTDWTKFPYDLIDFGWGPALFVTPVAMPLLDVIFVIRSGAESSGITVRLGLRPSYMDKFEQIFLDFASI
ncbi:hypothetical protein O6H91_10G110500 [Diphasiastrum complanatum]|uniref:Uncharacterized protein n=1 Tax=Diphasiastrum complanatum TaxID=34168 RepID=A0ACC2CKL1_DIPCM|nr:hypothetical protein O6H91_10G110500 [Diphasiastrum complanatum]